MISVEQTTEDKKSTGNTNSTHESIVWQGAHEQCQSALVMLILVILKLFSMYYLV